MISSKSLKFLLLFAFVFASSCRFWSDSSNSVPPTEPNKAPEIISEIPFPTKEPEIFQVEIVIKNEGEEDRIFLARSQGRFFSRSGEIATLQIETSQSFLINFGKKIYVENAAQTSAQSETSIETLNNFLTTEWLNQKNKAEFESLGTENGLSKYRVIFEAAESLIFVDENYKMPVRQEFYSIEDETKTLVYAIELQNLKLVADEQFFAVPKDFRKVPMAEFRKNE